MKRQVRLTQDNDESHLNGLHLSLGDQTTSAGGTVPEMLVVRCHVDVTACKATVTGLSNNSTKEKRTVS